MKPNLLEVAKVQMSKFLEGKNAIVLPEEINVNEAHLYHVAVVESKGNTKTFQYTHTLKMKKFGQIAWEKIKNNLKNIGIDEAHILHNPVIMEQDLARIVAREAEDKAAEEQAENDRIYAQGREKAKKALQLKAEQDVKRELEEENAKNAKTSEKVEEVIVETKDTKEAKEAKEEAKEVKEGDMGALAQFQQMKEEAKALGMVITSSTKKIEVAEFLREKAEQAQKEFDNNPQ